MNKELECININWRLLGAMCANLSSNEQIAFFKGFAIEMGKYPSVSQTEMQCAFISAGLTVKEKEIFNSIGYIEQTP